MNRRVPTLLAALVLVAAAFGPRVLAVGRAAGGLPQWTERAERFRDALEDGRLEDTFVATHPGLTQLWIAGAAIRMSGAETPRERMNAAEMSVALLGGLLVILAAVLIRRLLVLDGHPGAGSTAWLAGLFLALDPVSVLMTSHVGLDGVLALGALVSVLAACLHLRTGSLASLIGAALAAGLTVATKAPGLILLPLVVLLPLVAGRGRGGLRALRSGRVWGLTLAVLAGCVVVPISLLPAFWVEPIETLRTFLSGDHRTGSLAGALWEKQTGSVFFMGKATSRPGALFYAVQLLYRATPLVLIGAALLPLSVRRTPSRHVREVGLAFTVALLALTLAAKKKWRYASLLLPFLDVLAALGWTGLVLAIGRTMPRRVVATVVGVLVAVQGAWVLAGFPHFGLRINPLAGGTAAAYEVVRLTWGEGMEEAVVFLDDEAERLGRPITWSGGYRSPFGSCGETFGSDRLRWLGRDPPGVRADYHVLYDLYHRSGRGRLKEADQWWMAHGRVARRVVIDGLVVATVFAPPD